MNKKIIAAISVSTVFLGWFGFGESNASVTKCESTVTKYVTAEFSELVTGVDMNGDIYTEIDSWSDQASLKFKAVSIDGNLHSTNYDFNVTELDGYFAPPMPEHDKSIKAESHFDNFRFRSDSNLRIYTYNEDGYDSFSEPIGFTSECTDKLRTDIIVKEWYSISYGSEWIK